MTLVKGFGLVVLAVVAIVLATVLVALSPQVTTVETSVKALPSVQIKGYLMPSNEAVAVDYSQMTLRELKKLCKGTGIKNYGKLTKPQLVIALGAL